MRIQSIVDGTSFEILKFKIVDRESFIGIIQISIQSLKRNFKYGNVPGEDLTEAK